MTYGVNAPLGMQAATYGTSAPWTGGFQQYNITPALGTSLFLGDIVTLTDGLLVPYTTGSSAANPPLGVFWGCSFQDQTGIWQFQKYWPAGTNTFVGTYPKANVIVDSNTYFTIQANAAFPWSGLGSNFDVQITPGNTLTGESGTMLSVATGNTTATLPITAIAFDPIPGNVPATPTGAGSTSVPFANIIVKLNNTNFNAGATGA